MIKTLSFIICYLIYPFSFLFPRNKKSCAFGCYRKKFGDNSKYLFIYTVEHYKNLDCYWLSIERDTVKYVRSLGFPAFWVFSPVGIWKALRAKYWFVSAYTSDILYCLSGGAIVVNLWHGIGLKCCEFNILSGPLAERYVKKSLKERFFHPEVFRKPNYVLSSTEFQSVMFASAFRIPLQQCINLGYPRNQLLMQPKKEVENFIKRYDPPSTYNLIKKIQPFSKVYIYLPTWRDENKNTFAQILDINTLQNTLAEQNAILLLKPHANVTIEKFQQSDNIITLDQQIDIYCILPFVDVLITDYSSVLYDFILMENKSIILFLYDFEKYTKERNFYYPFVENTLGKRVTDFKDLLNAMRQNHIPVDNDQRNALLNKFWGDTMNQDVCANILAYLNISL